MNLGGNGRRGDGLDDAQHGEQRPPVPDQIMVKSDDGFPGASVYCIATRRFRRLFWCNIPHNRKRILIFPVVKKNFKSARCQTITRAYRNGLPELSVLKSTKILKTQVAV